MLTFAVMTTSGPQLRSRATRRATLEVVIEPDVRPHVRRRLAVDVIFAPDTHTAAVMLATELGSHR